MDETKQPQNEMPNEPQNERPSEPQNEKGAGAYIGTGMVFGLVIGAGMGDLSQGMLIGMAPRDTQKGNFHLARLRRCEF